MVNLPLKNWLKKFVNVATLYLIILNNAFASTTSNLPFVSKMEKLKDAICGPLMTSAATIMVAATCLMLAFGEWSDGFKRIITVVMWLSIALSVNGFINYFFGAGAVF